LKEILQENHSENKILQEVNKSCKIKFFLARKQEYKISCKILTLKILLIKLQVLQNLAPSVQDLAANLQDGFYWVSGLLDISAHFYGNRRKLIKIFFSMVFLQTNSYLPLLNPEFKTRPSTDFTPKLQVEWKLIFSLPTLVSEPTYPGRLRNKFFS